MASSLQINLEQTICEVPRGDTECLRFTFTTATTAEGKEISWHSIRVYFKSRDGKWLPTKTGVTIRSRELAAIASALVEQSKRGAA